MAKLNEMEVGKKIYEKIGGISNVNSVMNCMTRVRIDIKDESKVDIEGLKKIEGVLGVAEGPQLQIIVGPGASTKIANAMGEIGNISVDEDDESGKDKAERLAQEKKDEIKSKQKKTFFKDITKLISSIFVPLIPAFVGAGLIGGIASVFQNLMTAGNISGANWEVTISILNVIKTGVYGYLNIYVGINAAKVFGASDALGGVIGGVVYLTGMLPDVVIPNIFTGDPLVAGQGGIIGVIIAVAIMAWIEKKLHKIIPNSLDIIIVPAVTLLISGLITLLLIMPIAGWISNGLIGGIDWILTKGGIFAGFALGGLFLPLVIFGLHQILTPIHIEMINTQGATYLLPILAMAGAGQVGAALAVLVKCRKNKPLVNITRGSLPVGILGIGEPLIYAVTLPMGRAFITACIGGAIGGAVIGAFGGIGATAVGPSGVALIPLIYNNKWLGYVIGLLAGYAGGFVATYLFGIDKKYTEAVELD